MSAEGAARKVSSTANKLSKAVMPLATVMSAGRQPMQHLASGGFGGLWNFYAGTVIPNWTYPGWTQFKQYLSGPGGESIMTGISVSFVKWLMGLIVGVVPGSQSREVKAATMLLDAISGGAAGVAIGEAASMIIHGPSYAPGAGALKVGVGLPTVAGGPGGIGDKRGSLAVKREDKPVTTWPLFR